MKQARKTLALVAGLVLVAGCGDGSELGPGSERDTAPQPEPAASDDGAGETDETDADAPDELDVDDDSDTREWQFATSFDTPFVWDDSGVRLSVTGLGINDATHPDLPGEVAEFLDGGVQTIVVLEMTASNDSGQTIDFYPDQGQIQLGREQVDADLWFTDPIAGFDWRDGVDDDGQVFWMLKNTSFEDAVGAGELTFLASAAFSSDAFDPVTDAVEVAVTWDAP
jgi:hypothetical protein